MGNRGLDTGEFNEYGEWRSYRTKKAAVGPSPIPLLILAALLALVLLLRGEPEKGPLAAQSVSPELRMKFW